MTTFIGKIAKLWPLAATYWPSDELKAQGAKYLALRGDSRSVERLCHLVAQNRDEWMSERAVAWLTDIEDVRSLMSTVALGRLNYYRDGRISEARSAPLADINPIGTSLTYREKHIIKVTMLIGRADSAEVVPYLEQIKHEELRLLAILGKDPHYLRQKAFSQRSTGQHAENIDTIERALRACDSA